MKNIDEYLAFTIDRLPKGYVFSYPDFVTEVNCKEIIIKTLNCMAASGKIVKLTKGKFYEPEITPLGISELNREQVVKDLLENDGKVGIKYIYRF